MNRILESVHSCEAKPLSGVHKVETEGSQIRGSGEREKEEGGSASWHHTCITHTNWRGRFAMAHVTRYNDDS